MRARSDKYLSLIRSCREEGWSLYRLEQELKQYYSDQGRYRKGEKFSAALSWIRWAVRDEQLRRRRERQDKHEKAQRQVQRAVAKGELRKPEHCEQCQRPIIKHKLHGHHRDYRYPLRVIWLCPSCHVNAQGRRAVKRAAWHAALREWQMESDQAEQQLRTYYKGKVTRRQYRRLRLELIAQYEQRLYDIKQRFRKQ